MNKKYENRYVISLGGSLVVPNGGIDASFLREFDGFVRDFVEGGDRQIFIIVGGGATARHYRDAGQDVVGHQLPDDDLDWLGVHSTRLNGHLLRTIFKDIAHPVMLNEYDVIRKADESVVIGAGWKPGWSTDFCAALTCENYHIKSMVNLSNVSQVYDKDPSVHSDARPIKRISWEDFMVLVGDKWSPGMHAPFDPVASRRAKELGLKVKVVKGGNYENLGKALLSEDFEGTLIG